MIREKRADERQCVCDCVGVIGRRDETAGNNYNDSETHLNHPPNQSANHTILSPALLLPHMHTNTFCTMIHTHARSQFYSPDFAMINSSDVKLIR